MARNEKRTGNSRRKQPWRYKGAKYLSVPVVSPNSVSTGASVDTLRAALGMGPGPFDEAVRDEVMYRQERAKLPVTGVVTEEDWDAIVNPRPKRTKKSAAPAGGVKGTEKPDDTGGGLDSPEGSS